MRAFTVTIFRNKLWKFAHPVKQIYELEVVKYKISTNSSRLRSIMLRDPRRTLQPLNSSHWIVSRRCKHRTVCRRSRRARTTRSGAVVSRMQICLRCHDVTTIVNISLIVKFMTCTTSGESSRSIQKKANNAEMSAIWRNRAAAGCRCLHLSFYWLGALERTSCWGSLRTLLLLWRLFSR